MEGYHICDCQLIFSILLFSLHTEKLYNSTGRELRRALFSLKQIFQVIISPFLAFCGPFRISQHAHSHLDAALFSGDRAVLPRVCLRGSCRVFRSGRTSHTGAGLGWPGGQSAIEGEGELTDRWKREQQTLMQAQNRLE